MPRKLDGSTADQPSRPPEDRPMTDSADEIKDTATDAADQTKDKVAASKDKAAELAGTVKDKAVDIAGTVKAKAQDVAQKLDDKAEEMSTKDGIVGKAAGVAHTVLDKIDGDDAKATGAVND